MSKQTDSELRAMVDAIAADLANSGPHTIEHLLACASIGKHTTVIGKSRYRYLTELHDELVAALKAALAIKALWLPNPIAVDPQGEAEDSALYTMRDRFIAILAKVEASDER